MYYCDCGKLNIFAHTYSRKTALLLLKIMYETLPRYLNKRAIILFGFFLLLSIEILELFCHLL
jgi:hypothetical protein